jgi:glycosyltransferase involved in cell wall biosynthesis
MNNKTARIIFTRSGRGLLKDARLLEHLLNQNGWQVTMRGVSSSNSVERFIYYWERAKIRLPKPLRRVLDQLQIMIGKLRFGRVDLQIHLEIPFITFLGACPQNWLIPNQEWANMHQLQFLPCLSRILCKTSAAVDAYSPFNANVAFMGFSGAIALDLPEFSPESRRFRRFLHVAGNNRKKGSAAVIEAWRRNPHWPLLEFIVEEPSRFQPIPSNVSVRQAVSDQELDNLRRDCGVVLAPSEVEGFGHVILEAMAWGAVTITTDAAPMNELVGPGRGKLISWRDNEACRLGYRYYVSVEALEAVVNELLQANPPELTEMAGNARRWVEDNHQSFEARFSQQLSSLANEPIKRQDPA